MKTKPIFAALSVAALAIPLAAQAAVITIPQSALIPSTQLYTDDIGGGIGNPLVMTDGGNDANVGGSRNDDGFSGPIDLGFTLNFFGQDYTQFYANNNGNISFGNGISAFTPTGPQGAPQPIISPFFADVDTRGPASGLMNLRTMDNQLIVTWDRVGYFDEQTNLLNSFQLVLRGPGYSIPPGEGQSASSTRRCSGKPAMRAAAPTVSAVKPRPWASAMASRTASSSRVRRRPTSRRL